MIKYIIYIILIVVTATSCNGCSRSGKLMTNRLSHNRIERNEDNDSHDNFEHRESKNNRNKFPETSIEKNGFGSNEIRMSKESGVYKIPIIINGVKMYTIFDTGASLISISNTEASFLYKQGTLTESDFEGSVNFQDATGGISTGTIINLKEVQIGNIILRNVKASVVNNNSAPLLLGQSALSKFGKISIDYGKGILIFEK